MKLRRPRIVSALVAVPVLLAGAPLLLGDSAAAQGGLAWEGVPPLPAPTQPMVIHTAEEPNVLVRPLVTGLSHPWSLAFLPGGDMLVTERAGRLRVIRDGVLDPLPVSGVPEVSGESTFSGLLEVAPHPRFEDNRLVYLTYTSAKEGGTITLARARFDGSALHDLRVLLESKPPSITTSGSRLIFAPDGTLFMSVGGAFNSAVGGLRAQDPDDHAGKILRLRDDGSVPEDNPFVGRPGHLPEIYSMGHRNPMGFALHPVTGQLWAVEHAPQGGDEANVILPGRNYGWPIVSYGRQYSGRRVTDVWSRDGMEVPTVVWLPSIAPSGMIFYTGNRFPAWTGDLFVGSLMVGRVQRTGHIDRVVLNENGEEVARESILTELRQRIRDVRQGPDGLIYALTDEDDGVLLRLEPLD